MVTTDDLRILLREEEDHCPDLAGVRRAVAASGPSRRRGPGPILASAAAVAAVAVLTAVAVTAGGGGQAPVIEPGETAIPAPGASSSPWPAGAPVVSSAPVPQLAPEVASAQSRAERDAADAARSAESAAVSAAAAAKGRVEACSAKVAGVSITVDGSATGSVDGDTVQRLARACAGILGAKGALSVEWVDTTLDGLGKAIGSTESPRPPTRVVVAQVTGSFDLPFGDVDRPTSMLLILDPAGRLPGGAQIPVTGPDGWRVDLALAGTVHR